MGIYSGISTKWLFIHCFQIKLEFRNVDFCEGRKTEEPGEKPSEQGENQQQTQPTCDAGSGNRTRATVVGDECSHHCAIPAPLCSYFMCLYLHICTLNNNHLINLRNSCSLDTSCRRSDTHSVFGIQHRRQCKVTT